MKYLDLQQADQFLEPDIQAAVSRVTASGQWIDGPETKGFEQELAEYLGIKHAICVHSGTAALELSLAALNLPPESEVITTPFTFRATGEAIVRTGHQPVYCDVDPHTYNLDVQHLEGLLSKNTKVIMPVHLFGLPVDMTQVQQVADQHNLYVIEDAAQSIGAKFESTQTGTMGHIGCFSFYPTKNLGARGDAGAIVTDDDVLAEHIRTLMCPRGRSTTFGIGTNVRGSEYQAAILRTKLPHLDEVYNGKRQEFASRYRALLSGVAGVSLPAEGSRSSATHHHFTVRATQRDALREALNTAGVPTAIYYQDVLPDLTGLAGRGDISQARLLTKEVLSLPVAPHLTAKDIHYVTAAVRSFCESNS